MQYNSSFDSAVRISKLSSTDCRPTWSVVLFAFNEAKTIAAALGSIKDAVGDQDAAIYVIANGCTDSTAEKVRDQADKFKHLCLIETDIADKANAWNLFIHDLPKTEPTGQFDIYFFMDGDVVLLPNTLRYLAVSLAETPRAEAAGAMPASGRNRDTWRQRMVLNNMLAGNCYALRGSFVQYIRERQLRMPIGLIGEDFFVSWMIASNAWRDKYFENRGLRCVFNGRAEFAFESLSPLQLSHYRTYLRRKWRYALREIQHPMLVQRLEAGLGAVPHNVDQLYRSMPPPRLFQWCGKLGTPIRALVARHIRKKRKVPP